MSDEKEVRILWAKDIIKPAVERIEKDGCSYKALDSSVNFLSDP